MTTHLETIRAAIHKLERLKRYSVQGEWYWEEPRTESFPQGDQSLLSRDGDLTDTVLSGWGYDAWGLEAEPADRELIVTLHRTIEPQLSILKDAAEYLEFDRERPTPIYSWALRAWNLAQAILDGDE